MNTSDIFLIYYFYPIIKIRRLDELGDSFLINSLLSYVDLYRIRIKEKKKEIEKEIFGILIVYGAPFKKSEIITNNKWKARIINFYLAFYPFNNLVNIEKLFKASGRSVELLENINIAEDLDLAFLNFFRETIKSINLAHREYRAEIVNKTSTGLGSLSDIFTNRKKLGILISILIIIMVLYALIMTIPTISHVMQALPSASSPGPVDNTTKINISDLLK